ncbi:MAG TPA: hypothetical protein VLW55_11425 [Burkholderiaceae bacterium]|nr:hypothetical protein [Burkholderiaceae bacterium]
MTAADLRRAAKAAKQLFAAGAVEDPWVRSHARLEQPIEVMAPGGSRAAWFIPVLAEQSLVGYLLLDPALQFIKWSSFQRRPGSLERCPKANAWIDPERVVAIARQAARADTRFGTPTLSYDGVLDRIAWRVPATGPDGKTSTIFVAGEFAYAAR